jgi:hypothetical protein
MLNPKVVTLLKTVVLTKSAASKLLTNAWADDKIQTETACGQSAPIPSTRNYPARNVVREVGESIVDSRMIIPSPKHHCSDEGAVFLPSIAP